LTLSKTETVETPPDDARHGARVLDPSDFARLAAVALVAFATDESYAVRMARGALRIQRNRVRRAELAQRRRALVMLEVDAVPDRTAY